MSIKVQHTDVTQIIKTIMALFVNIITQNREEKNANKNLYKADNPKKKKHILTNGKWNNFKTLNKLNSLV